MAATEGFLRLEEEALGRLLDEDGLIARSEERVFEAVARWMPQGGGGRGDSGPWLLGKVRFALAIPFRAAFVKPSKPSNDFSKPIFRCDSP
jgi:hypothetical protein